MALGENATVAGVRNRPPLSLTEPLVGWSVVDIPPDGTLHPVLGADWTDAVQVAPACRLHPDGRQPRQAPFLGRSALRPVVATAHEPPAPFCVCGLGALYSLRLHRCFDAFRDRLGYRLRCLAIVQLWGRMMLESGGVRAQYGRVLAIMVPEGETGARGRRVEAAADRLGARIVAVDPDAFDAAAVLRREAPEGAHILSRGEFVRSAGNGSARRWRSIPTQRASFKTARLIVCAYALLFLAVGAGLHAAGVVSWPTVGLALSLSSFVAVPVAVRRADKRAVCVEAVAPAPPACPTPAGRPTALTRGSSQVTPVAVLADLMALWR